MEVMQTAPTPGPWHVGVGGIKIIGANSQRVAVCDENHATPGLANAQLIAAAPDLLEAMRCILDLARIEGGRPVAIYSIARAAIAKATEAA